MIDINITDFDMYEASEADPALEIVSGNFFEGETVTVRILGKEFTRKVKYSARKWADLYITVNGHDITAEEFFNPEDFRDTDYTNIVK